MQSLARERWKILQQAVLSPDDRERQHNSGASNHVGGFSSFNLFTVVPASPSLKRRSSPCDETERVSPKFPAVSEEWITYKVKGNIDKTRHVEVVVKLVSEKVSLETLVGFNNTGNVCVWPSEEVMAYYCLKRLRMFQGASVCELGGGMTSLSGLLLASTQVPSKVLLTDGNQKAVHNLQEIIANNVSLIDSDVSAKVLLWDQSFLNTPSIYDASFDFVLCADCLFFEQSHSELAQAILKLMKMTGEAIIFAPKRSGTFEQFCVIARKFFDLQVIPKYDDFIWHKHETLQMYDDHYKEDLHYPVMISLKKINTMT